MFSKFRGRILFFVLFLSLSLIFSCSLVFYLLYTIHLDIYKAALLNQARTLKAFILSFSERDKGVLQQPDFSNHLLEHEPFLLHLRTVKDLFPGLGKTGEFTIARVHNENIEFLVHHRKNIGNGKLESIPFQSSLAVPMRKALTEKYGGVVIGPDYRGVEVLAVYEPLPQGMGIVSKMDMNEIKKPYRRALVFTSLLICLFVVSGSFFVIRSSERITSEIEALNESLLKQVQENKKNEEKFRNFADYTYDWEIWRNPEGQFIYVSPSCERITGYKVEEFMKDSELFFRIVHPEDVFKHHQHFKTIYPHECSEFDFRIIKKDGSIRSLGHVCQPVYNSSGVFVGIRGSNRDITPHVESEELLRKTREHLLQTLNAITDGIWEWNFKKNEIFFSPKYYTMLGYEPYEFPETHESWASLLHPEDRDAAILKFQEYLSLKSDRYENLFRMKTKEGTYRWIHSMGKIVERDVTGDPILMIGHHSDITDIKEYEIRLLEMKEQFSQIADNIEDAFLLYDLDRDRLLYSNSAFEKMVGKRDIIGSTLKQFVLEFIDPQDRVEAENIFSQFKNGTLSEFNTEFRILQADGNKGWIRLRGALVLNSIHKEKRIAMIASDITPFKEAAEKERLQQDQLIQADKMISLGLLVSGVAHEINNPNNYIMLNVPLLRKAWETVLPVLHEYCREKGDFQIKNMSFSEFSENILPLMDGIQEGSKKIQHIVADLKNYARQDHYSSFSEINLNTVVQSAVNLISAYIRKSCSRFSCALSGEPLLVQGSFQKMEQVVVNLIQNAADSLTDSHQKILIETFKDSQKSMAGIRVIDEGKGIAPQDLSKLTLPFYTTKRDKGGTGLGLSISSGIIKDHQGDIFFNSIPDKGTTVTVLIPFGGKP